MAFCGKLRISIMHAHYLMSLEVQRIMCNALQLCVAFVSVCSEFSYLYCIYEGTLYRVGLDFLPLTTDMLIIRIQLCMVSTS